MFSPWFQDGVAMLKMVHGVTHTASKRSIYNKYDMMDDGEDGAEGAGLVFRTFAVVLTHEFICLNSVRKSRTSLFFSAALVIWKRSHVLLCLFVSSPTNIAFLSSHWHPFPRGDAGELTLVYNLVHRTLSQNKEVNCLWQSTEQKYCISWPDIFHEIVKVPTSRVRSRS